MLRFTRGRMGFHRCSRYPQIYLHTHRISLYWDLLDSTASIYSLFWENPSRFGHNRCRSYWPRVQLNACSKNWVITSLAKQQLSGIFSELLEDLKVFHHVFHQRSPKTISKLLAKNRHGNYDRISGSGLWWWGWKDPHSTRVKVARLQVESPASLGGAVLSRESVAERGTVENTHMYMYTCIYIYILYFNVYTV